MENKTEKLKGLIGSSTILTQYERVEWLSLLELMNDKQLAELEKILISSQPASLPVSESAGQKVSSEITSPSPSSARRGMDAGSTKDITKPEPAKQPPVTPMPKLSHIMNLPHIGGVPASQLVNKSAGQPTSLSVDQQTSKSDKKKSGFANKLKTIFAEKELPAGKTHEPLELTAGKPVSVPANQSVTLMPSPVVQSVGGQSKPANQSNSQIVSKPVSKSATQPAVKEPAMVHLAMKSDSPVQEQKITKPSAPLPPKVPMPPVKTVIQPVIIPVMAPIKMADLPPVVIKQVAKPNEVVQEEVLSLLKHKKPKTDPDFNPGVNFEKTTEQSRTDNLDKIKLHMAATGSAKGVAELGKDPKISDLKDLTLISLQVVKESSLTGFVNKIRQLISKFGYFQVVFNIEESPAYKAYIATGLKLLTDGNNFSQLEQAGEIEKFLDKDSFEKFADILAKIQGS